MSTEVGHDFVLIVAIYVGRQHVFRVHAAQNGPGAAVIESQACRPEIADDLVFGVSFRSA
jgi:hypothetical protein